MRDVRSSDGLGGREVLATTGHHAALQVALRGLVGHLITLCICDRSHDAWGMCKVLRSQMGVGRDRLSDRFVVV